MISRASLMVSVPSSCITNVATTWWSTFVFTARKKRGREYLVVLQSYRRQMSLPYLPNRRLCHDVWWTRTWEQLTPDTLSQMSPHFFHTSYASVNQVMYSSHNSHVNCPMNTTSLWKNSILALVFFLFDKQSNNWERHHSSLHCMRQGAGGGDGDLLVSLAA